MALSSLLIQCRHCCAHKPVIKLLDTLALDSVAHHSSLPTVINRRERSSVSFVSIGGDKGTPASHHRRRRLNSCSDFNQSSMLHSASSTAADHRYQPPDMKEWNVNLLLSPSSTSWNFAVVILNCEIGVKRRPLVFDLWKRARMKVAVDGGVDRIWELVSERTTSAPDSDLLESSLVPDLVTGDFDSASPALLESLKKLGTTVVPTPDQDETDFTKCLQILHRREAESSTKLDAVLAIGSCGSRLDHCMGIINSLHKKYMAGWLPDCDTFLMLDDDICWLLPPGRHMVSVPAEFHGQICALIPFAGPAKGITTTGLKWNLQNQCLEFGGLVSTSNQFTEAEQVYIECEDPVTWVMNLNKNVLLHSGNKTKSWCNGSDRNPSTTNDNLGS